MKDIHISRELLNSKEKTYLLEGIKDRADIYVIKLNGDSLVVKDYYFKKGWVRQYGRFLIKKEYRLYKKLNQMFDCFPKVYCMPDGYSLVMEYIDGKTMEMVEENEGYCYAVSMIEKCIEKLHKNNIFHLDLRKRGNILITDDRVYFIDLASMIMISQLSPLLLFKPIFRMVDLSSVLKWKKYVCPSRLTEDDLRKIRLFQWIRVLWIFNKPKLPRIRS